jgi:hypothetical protein
LAIHAPVLAVMARKSISLPDSLINKLEDTKPEYIGFSAHVRGLIYKGLEMVEMEKKIIADGARSKCREGCVI